MAHCVAIDGPAGAGKSTVARGVAAALGFTYLDTGAMYRAVAWKALQEGIDPANEARIARIAEELPIWFGPLGAAGQTVLAAEEDVTQAIRTPEVSRLTSMISTLSEVRQQIVARQRQMGSSELGVVLEGRDIGTVVFPNAELKIFLTASAEERARRRFEQTRKLDPGVCYEQVLADQRERDERDTSRETSPLTAADDAVQLPTDGLSAEQVIDRILAIWTERSRK